MADPNSDDAEPMGRGLASFLMVIGAVLAVHFGLKLEEAIEQDANPLGMGYVGVFVLVGIAMMALGLKRFSEASQDGKDDDERQ